MSIVHATEFLANVPGALKDKTVNMFTLTDEGPSEFTIVVSRDRYKVDNLDAYVERQVTVLSARMPLFKVTKHERIVLDKKPALLTDSTYQSPHGKLFQRQVTVYFEPTSHMLLITGLGKDPLKPKWEVLYNEFLTGFRLRG